MLGWIIGAKDHCADGSLLSLHHGSDLHRIIQAHLDHIGSSG